MIHNYQGWGWGQKDVPDVSHLVIRDGIPDMLHNYQGWGCGQKDVPDLSHVFEFQI